jgi:hypothetical protein
MSLTHPSITHTRSILAIVLAALAVFLLANLARPPIAHASWPCYRSKEENHHCYALAQWHMVGCPKECVEGGVADISTEIVEVPGWASGDFVTNEMWVSNHTSPAWVESGQIAGAEYSCCGMHPFFAAMAENEKFYFYEQPGEIGQKQYNDYVIQDLGHLGTWSIYWGKENNGWVEEHQYGSLWSYADELEAGFEGGANTQPNNEGSQALASVYGNAWHPWEGGYATTKYYSTPGALFCIAPWQNSWPGNAKYATPCP